VNRREKKEPVPDGKKAGRYGYLFAGP